MAVTGPMQSDTSDSAALPDKGRAAVPDVISALRAHDGRLPAGEQRVADHVKAHLDEISTLTIAELARATGVSRPTVIRFCRSLGCEGFREFKLRLAQNLAVSLQYLDARTGVAAGGTETAIDEVLSALYATANVMRQQLDARCLDRARRAIIAGRHLLIAGIGGGSSMVASEAENRFFRLGIPCNSVSDSYTLQMRAATLDADDVLLLISASGEADAIVGAAKVASGYGATTVCLTRPHTRLAAAADIVIAIELPEDTDIFKPTASRYAHLTILDALAMSVARDRPDRTRESLRRIRASLTAYHGRTGPQPLGD